MENLRVPTNRNSRVIFRMDLTEIEREGALSRSEYGLVLGFSEHSDEARDAIKGWKYVDRLSNC